MIELLAKLIVMEATVLMALSFKTVLRKPTKKALDFVKLGQAPQIIFLIAATFLALLISGLYTIFQIRLRSIHAGSIDYTDQVLLAHKLLQSSLIGLLLFLLMLIDRFQCLMRERQSVNKIFKAEEKELKDWKHIIAVQVHELENENVGLRERIKKLESDCQRKTDETKAKEDIVSALKEQSEKFNLEYDRLLEYNQTLRNQLQSIAQTLLTDKQDLGWTGLKASLIRDGLKLLPWGIQEPDENREELRSDNDVVTNNNHCHQLLVSGHRSPSFPRHRRPIDQH